MAGQGTQHHKVHSWTGWGLIIGLPFAICSAVCAVRGGTDGFISWLSAPVGAIGFLAFATAALWYCKLEFDEVIMDYFDGGLRRFALSANRLVAVLAWLMSAYAVLSMAFLG